jgi:hypothetical protein
VTDGRQGLGPSEWDWFRNEFDPGVNVIFARGSRPNGSPRRFRATPAPPSRLTQHPQPDNASGQAPPGMFQVELPGMFRVELPGMFRAELPGMFRARADGGCHPAGPDCCGGSGAP